jgi:hypothetical protein
MSKYQQIAALERRLQALCPASASLRYARSRQAGPQKRDHGRAGRKSAGWPLRLAIILDNEQASDIDPDILGALVALAVQLFPHSFSHPPSGEYNPLSRRL